MGEEESGVMERVVGGQDGRMNESGNQVWGAEWSETAEKGSSYSNV
jgi:hypothetical protein